MSEIVIAEGSDGFQGEVPVPVPVHEVRFPEDGGEGEEPESVQADDAPRASVIAFNHYYAALLRDVKAHGACRGAIKRNYHRFDHASASHVVRFLEWTPTLVKQLYSDGESVEAVLDRELDTQLFEGIFLEQVLAAGVSRPALVQALFALAAASRLYAVDAGDDDVDAVRRCLQAANEGGDEVQGIPGIPEGSDDVVRALVAAAQAHAAARRRKQWQQQQQQQQQLPELPSNVADQLRRLEDSKIGRMAREISESLGPDALSDPAGLASVIGKVGGVMQAKMRNGELDHGELLKEAMGMLGSLPSIFQAAAGAASAASAAAPGAENASAPSGTAAPGGVDVMAMADMLKGVLGAFGGAAPKAAAQASRGHESSGATQTRARLAAKLAKRQQQSSSVYT